MWLCRDTFSGSAFRITCRSLTGLPGPHLRCFLTHICSPDSSDQSVFLQARPLLSPHVPPHLSQPADPSSSSPPVGHSSFRSSLGHLFSAPLKMPTTRHPSVPAEHVVVGALEQTTASLPKFRSMSEFQNYLPSSRKVLDLKDT